MQGHDHMQAHTVILALLASAVLSALALWASLSPYRQKYAEDPSGKRSPTFKRDAELVNSLWWDVVFYHVTWIVLGLGAALVLTRRMELLTEIQGALLQIFVLITAPSLSVCYSGGTAQRDLKAPWVQPFAKATGIVLRAGLAIFSLLVIRGTLNWAEGTWIGSLRTKGGLLFDVGYVAVIAAAVWFGSSAMWRATRTALVAHDERQETARRVRRKAPREKRAKPKRPRPSRAELSPAPSSETVAASDEFDLVQVSVPNLQRVHERSLQRVHDALAVIEKPDAWSKLTATWVDGMIAFLRNENAPLPQWLYAAEAFVSNDNRNAALEEQSEFSALRLIGAWAKLKLEAVSADGQADADPSEKRDAHRAMANFIGVVTRRIGENEAGALRAYVQDLMNTGESMESSGEPDFQALFIERMRTHRERMQLALHLLSDPVLDQLITGESHFDALPDVMLQLANGTLDSICHRIAY